MLVLNCTVCGKKKSRFIENLGTRTLLSNIPLIGDISLYTS